MKKVFALSLLTLPLLTLAACAPAVQGQASASNINSGDMKQIQQRHGTTEVQYVVPAKEVTAVAVAAQPDAGWQPLPYLVPAAQAAKTFIRAEQVIESGKQYRAVLNTSKGLITVELYPDKAPQAVNNFVFLACNHFYAGTPFHRVIDGFMAQGGDPTGTGMGGPGYSFGYEVNNGLNFNEAGVLGMARSASPDSQGSQFFITLAPASFLNDQYTVFGRVVEGQNVLNALTKTATSGDRPIAGVQPDVLNTVTILSR